MQTLALTLTKLLQGEGKVTVVLATEAPNPRAVAVIRVRKFVRHTLKEAGALAIRMPLTKYVIFKHYLIG